MLNPAGIRGSSSSRLGDKRSRCGETGRSATRTGDRTLQNNSCPGPDGMRAGTVIVTGHMVHSLLEGKPQSSEASRPAGRADLHQTASILFAMLVCISLLAHIFMTTTCDAATMQVLCDFGIS